MHHRLILSLITVFLLLLSSCTPKATQPSANNSPTSTPTQILLAMTPTSTPEASITPTDKPPELCDNDYLPNDESTTWHYAGNSSAKGKYTRTDTISESRDDGFTMTTQLKDVSYVEEYTCTEAGLINLIPNHTDIAAIFSGPNGNAIVKRRENSGISLPRNVIPGQTWQQIVGWDVTSASISGAGSFTYQYTAMDIEHVEVPLGQFDALRIDIDIQILITDGARQFGGPYTTTLWFVKDIGLVKSEGRMNIPGVKFTDQLVLESFDSQ